MLCITLGRVILLIIILAVVLGVINWQIPSSTIKYATGTIMTLGIVGLFGWWGLGYFTNCDSGYLGGKEN